MTGARSYDPIPRFPQPHLPHAPGGDPVRGTASAAPARRAHQQSLAAALVAECGIAPAHAAHGRRAVRMRPEPARLARADVVLLHRRGRPRRHVVPGQRAGRHGRRGRGLARPAPGLPDHGLRCLRHHAGMAAQRHDDADHGGSLQPVRPAGCHEAAACLVLPPALGRQPGADHQRRQVW